MSHEEEETTNIVSENRSLPVWKRGLKRLRENGPVYVIQRIRFRLYEAYREQRLGISTKGFIPWNELCQDERNHDYDPTLYPLLDRLMQYVQKQVSDPFVVDYGAGKGRTVVVAGTYSFKGVIGIELNQELVDMARVNLGNARNKLRCSNVEIIHKNAMEWEFPAEANVVFMFNPFSGEVMQAVVDQIHTSLKDHPRDLKILFIYPHKIIENPFKEINWLQQEQEVETGITDHLRCIIYKNCKAIQ